MKMHHAAAAMPNGFDQRGGMCRKTGTRNNNRY